MSNDKRKYNYINFKIKYQIPNKTKMYRNIK